MKSAGVKALREAGAALRAFLRGFVGMRLESDRAGGGKHTHAIPVANAAPLVAPTPASVRAALATRAAGRGTCC